MNIGMDRNPVMDADTDPIFMLGGVIYPVTKNFDVDCGVKTGLTRPAPDLTFLLGTAVRF